MPPINTISPPDWLGEVVTYPVAQLGDTAPEVAKSAALSISAATDALYQTYGEVESTARKLTAGTAVKVAAGKDLPPGRMVGGQFVPFHGSEQEFAAAARKAFDRAARTFEAGMETGRNARASLARKVDQALRPAAVPPSVAAEIRQHVKSLKSVERLPFVTGLVESDDKLSVAAVLEGPPFLSGLTSSEIALVRSAAADKFAPADHAALKAVDRTLEAADAASRSFVERMRPHLHAPATKRDEAKASLARLAGGAQ